MNIVFLGVWHVHAHDYVVELLERSDVSIIGVWDADQARARAFGQKYGLRVVDSIEEVVSLDGVSVAIVCSETSTHGRVIRQALDSGLHVFTEKVLARRSDEVTQLIALAKSKNRQLMVSFQRLREDWVEPVISVIESGAIGELTSSRIRYQHAGIIEGWLPLGFLDMDEACGGALIDLGVHGLYLSPKLHGQDVNAVTCRLAYKHSDSVEDSSIVILEYNDGTTSVLETSICSGPTDSKWIEIFGTAGSITVDPFHNILLYKGQGLKPAGLEPSDSEWTPLKEFIANLRTGVYPAWNSKETIKLASLVEAAYESAERGETMVVSSAGPRF